MECLEGEDPVSFFVVVADCHEREQEAAINEMCWFSDQTVLVCLEDGRVLMLDQSQSKSLVREFGKVVSSTGKEKFTPGESRKQDSSASKNVLERVKSSPPADCVGASSPARTMPSLSSATVSHDGSCFHHCSCSAIGYQAVNRSVTGFEDRQHENNDAKGSAVMTTGRSFSMCAYDKCLLRVSDSRQLDVYDIRNCDRSSSATLEDLPSSSKYLQLRVRPGGNCLLCRHFSCLL